MYGMSTERVVVLLENEDEGIRTVQGVRNGVLLGLAFWALLGLAVLWWIA